MSRISVVGTGYLGLTHAVCMAELGHEVIALDIDQEKIEKLRSGIVPFHEPELPELLKKVTSSGKLKFTTSWSEVAEFADIHFICVGTPQKQGSEAADISQVTGSVELLVREITKPSTIIGKSTVPVGTSKMLTELIDKNSKIPGQVDLVWNPEFLREGFAVKDTLHPDRIVIGIQNPASEGLVRNVYSTPLSEGIPFIVTDYQTAELVKVAANSFLATKISFINAFAMLSQTVGADITTLADAIGFDDRIGRKFLNAGIGFGGGCLPKDIRALRARATELGHGEQFKFLETVDEINKARRTQVVELALAALPEKNGKVAVLGAAFKPNSDDIRDSPALDIAKQLHAAGVDVWIHDPEALHLVNASNPELKTSDDLSKVFADADLVLHLTEWTNYRELDPAHFVKIVKTPQIIDGRNILDRQLWNNAGWTISYLGKPSS